MNNRLLLGAAAVMAAALAGCATDKPTAEVTRFHLAIPAARGALVVEPAPPLSADSVEFRTYAASVQGELGRVGYTAAPSLGQAEVVATLDVGQQVRQGAARRSSFSFGFGVGGGSFGRHGGSFGGGGVGATVPVGQARASDLVQTFVAIRLKRKSDQTVIWEGRAVAEARGNSPLAQPTAAVQRLTAALLQNFPGPSGQTVRVPLA